MKIYLRCIPCFARQAVEAAEMATDDPALREKIVREALKVASTTPFDKTPPHIGMEIHRIIRRIVGNTDPYKELKEKYNKKAMSLYPYMKEIVEKSENRLDTAVRIAIAGNIIDFGISATENKIHLNKIIEETLKSPFAVYNFDQFEKDIKTADNILYIADNAGEIVFDRVLIEEIPDYRKKVTLVVRGHPVINDATMEDAEQCGLTKLVRVINNGSDAPGTILETCSEEFRHELKIADLIIAKGQGNYETLSEIDKNIYFLLKAKCNVLANDLNVNVGDIILKKNYN